jgi:hypothetical protein
MTAASFNLYVDAMIHPKDPLVFGTIEKFLGVELFIYRFNGS